MEIEQVLYQLIMYLNCMFEIYLLYVFIETLVPVYEDRKWVMYLEAFGCITGIFLVNHLKMPLVNSICVPLIYILFVWLIFHVGLKKSLPYCIFYYLILAVSEVVFMYIYPMLGIDVDKINSGRVFLLIVQDTLRFVIIQVIKQHHIPDRDSSSKYTKSLYVLPVTTMILLNGFIVSAENPFGYILIIIGSVLVIVCNIIIFYVIEKLFHAQNMIKDNEMLLLKTKLEQQHFKRIEEINDGYARYIHDLLHILKDIACLAEAKDNGKIRELSGEAVESLKQRFIIDKKQYIDDTIVNAIFADRENIAKEKGIAFNIKIKKGIDISFINDIDKIRIFGNLIDHAIEAAAACDHGYISLELRQGNDSIVVFHLTNKFKEKAGSNDEAKSGFGIKHVEELAGKYNGILNISEAEYTRAVTLLLSNVKNQ